MKIITFIGLLGTTLFASYLGVYSQDIAYFFEEYFSPFHTLVTSTLLSVALFIVTFIVATFLLLHEKLNHTMYLILFFLNVVIGFFISCFSLFVLAMWWH